MQHFEIAPAFPQPIIFPDVDAETIAAAEATSPAPGNWGVFMSNMLAPLPQLSQRHSGLRLLPNRAV
jgi:hypothetical protein